MKIKELTLFTNNINKQKDFYSKILEFEEIKPVSGNEISFKIGNSVLKFIKRSQITPYHFAINIYSNQEQEALLWLKERVSILMDGRNEIQDFESWNAKAIYFYDEDKNIVEFISRKNLRLNSNKAFSPGSLLGISEIGLPTVNIEEVYRKLNNKIDLSIYSGSFDAFCAIGDENGLIICINQIKKKWFPVYDKAFPSEFNSEIVNKNKAFIISYRSGILNINQKSNTTHNNALS